MGLALVFSQFQVLLSHLWGFIKIDGREKRYKGRERRSRTRKKEREKEGIKERKHKKKIIIKIYFKKKEGEREKKTSLLASNWPTQFCWSFWLQPTQGA